VTRRAALALAALALASLAAAKPAKPRAKPPEPYVDDVAGFTLTLPAGWQRVEQKTGGGDAEPLYKATNDKTDQFLVVVRLKGPTDDAWEKPDEALASFEQGFAKADGYARMSLKAHKLPRRKGLKGTIPAADLWFRMTRGGKVVAVGARAIFFRGYTLTIVVDSPGKQPTKGAKAVVESFAPALVDD
jgi:hypothetical protein